MFQKATPGFGKSSMPAWLELLKYHKSGMLTNSLNTLLNVTPLCLSLKSQGEQYVQQLALKGSLGASFV